MIPAQDLNDELQHKGLPSFNFEKHHLKHLLAVVSSSAVWGPDDSHTDVALQLLELLFNPRTTQRS